MNQRKGLDERVGFYPDKLFIDNITSEIIFKIHETTEKIYFLESKNIHIDDKLYKIGNINFPDAYNLINGGLFNDWNFEFQN
jgi:hypothetical protein